MIYTPMTNSRLSRAVRARYYGGLRPYISQRSAGAPPASTIGFPSVFREVPSTAVPGSTAAHGKLVVLDALIKRASGITHGVRGYTYI